MGVKSFEEAIKQLVVNRITNTEFVERGFHQRVAKQRDERFKEVLNALPEEKRGVLIDLDSDYGANLNEHMEHSYKQGFIDCLNLVLEIENISEVIQE